MAAASVTVTRGRIRLHMPVARVRRKIDTPGWASKASAPAAIATTTITPVWPTWLM